VRDGLVVAAVLGGTLGLAVLPVLLPWPSKVRWILAVEAANPLIAVTNARRDLHVSPVVLEAVDNRADRLALVVRDGDSGGDGGRHELVGPPAPPGLQARLEGWCHARTPLLLVGDGHHRVALHGPDATARGLRDAERV